MRTKIITVRDFLEKARKDGLLLNENLEKAITSQTDESRIISDGLVKILRKTFREVNEQNLGIYTTAAIIIGALK